MVTLRFEVDGEYTDEQIDQALFIIGELVINKAKEYIRAMDLIQSSNYLQQWFTHVENGNLTIENANKYAIYLEYGTYEYFLNYGEDNFPDPSHPKKKDLPIKDRSAFPMGMQPFAPLRRVMYNDEIMKDIIQQAFDNVSS